MTTETVLLLHGLGRLHYSMRPLAKALERAGYRTLCWQYNSVQGDLPKLVAQLKTRLAELGPTTRLHAVGHSMGGLLLREILTGCELPLGRLVLLGTPSHGAQLIDRLGWLFNLRFMPQTIRDMHPASAFIGQLARPAMPVGVIAGLARFNPVNPVSWVNHWVLGDQPHDGTVELSSVQLPDMADYIEMPVNHTFLPTSRKVIPAVVRFIQTGQFRPN